MNNAYKNIYGFILIALFLIFSAVSAWAQTAENPADVGLGDLSAPAVEIIISSSGAIGNTALLKAKTDNINANASMFEWYLDDKLAPFQSGKAKTEFSFKTSKTFHIVRLVISENGQKLTENTVSVMSFNVTLAWHTDTFTPADYEGKAMPSVGSRVTVTAIPEIRNENPEDLLYTWYVDSESQVRGAVGEQEFSFNIAKNVSFVPIVVEVSTQSQSITVKGAINIPVVRPSMVLYHSRQREETGMSNDPVSIKAGEQSYFYAKPFYFHINSIDDLSYEWLFADKNILGVPPDPNLLILSIPKNSGAGSQILTVSVNNPAFLGEQAATEMEVKIQ